MAADCSRTLSGCHGRVSSENKNKLVDLKESLAPNFDVRFSGADLLLNNRRVSIDAFIPAVKALRREELGWKSESSLH